MFTSNIYFYLFIMVFIVRPAFGSDIQTPTGNIEEGLWRVFLNQRDTNDTTFFLRKGGGRIWVTIDSLRKWKLQIPSVTTKQYQGVTYLPLDALHAKYQVDELTQTIRIDVPAAAFESSQHSVREDGSPTPILPDSPGGFLNYDATITHDITRTRLNAFTELGFFNQWGVGTATMLERNLGSGARDKSEILRLDSTWTSDRPDQLVSLRVGDAISSPGSWGGSVRFGGIQWATNFATRPDLVTFPMPGATGEALLPSSVDIYVDNVLSSRQEVPAGPFAITNLPVITGQGDVRMVVRDLLGREQIITQPYYASGQMLQQGLSSFSYETGFIRKNYGVESFDYGRGFLAGTYRRGLSDTFTGEVHTELLATQQTLGISASHTLPFGVVDFSLAGSHNDASTGTLAALGFQHQSRRWHFSARTQRAEQDFVHLGASANSTYHIPATLSYLSIGSNFERYGSINVAYTNQDNRDKDNVEILNVSYNLSIGKIGYLGLSYLHPIGEGTGGNTDDVFGLTFVTQLDDRTNASVQTYHSKNDRQSTLQLQRSLNRSEGFGYRLATHFNDPGDERTEGSLMAQNNVGYYELDVSHTPTFDAARGTVRGGIAVIDEGFHFARKLDDSFALVQVPDLPHTVIYADNNPIGTTDDQGELLVPQLRPYQKNPIRIDMADIPLGAQVDSAQIDAVPYYRSGYTIRFPITLTRGATLTVVARDGKPLPAGATAQIDGQGERFPFGLDGQLYITGLQVGRRYHIEATWESQSCSFNIEYPENEDPLPDLGTVTCER